MQRMVCAALLSVMLGSVGVVVAEDVDPVDLKRATRLTERGLKALEAGNLSKAREFYERALKLLPSYPDANLGLGHIAMRERRFEEALTRYNEAQRGFVVLGAALFDVRHDKYNRAQEQLMLHRNKLMALQSALTRGQREQGRQGGSTNTRTLARIQTEITQTEQLIEQLENVEPPTHEDAGTVPGEIHFFIGNALLNLGRTTDAIVAWKDCAKKAPSFALVHHNLAVAYWQLDRFEQALEHLERSEELGYQGNPAFKADLQRSIVARDGRAAAAGSAP